jgi:hypothetical protein
MDFLNSLSIQETTPLLSIAEVEQMGKSFSNKESEQTGKEEQEEQTTEAIEAPGGLMPITSLVESKELETKEEGNKTKTKLNTSDYLTIIKGLQDKTGELEDFDEESFKGDPEEVIELLETLIYKNAENLLNDHIKDNLPSDYQKFVELTDAGISDEDAASVVKGLKSISGITPDKLDESEDLARQTYTQYLKLTSSWTDTKIKKEVDRLADLGTITEEAKESLPELVQIINNREAYFKAEAKKKEDQDRVNEVAQAKQLKDYLETTDEIAGIKLNKKMKDNWMKQYSPVKTPSGQVTTTLGLKQSYNPQEFGALVNFYDSIGLFKYDARSKKFTPDFSVLKSLGTKETIQKFSEAVENEKLKSQTKGGTNPEVDELKNEDVMARFKEIQDAWTKNKSNTPYSY